MLRRAPRTSLAWKNLSHGMARTVVSIGGISFAIILMFMQLGFLGSVGDTAVVVYDRMDCDLIVRSKNYLHVYDPSIVPDGMTSWLTSVSEVAQAVPIDIGVTWWQSPVDGSFQGIALMGVDLDRPALNLKELRRPQAKALRSRYVGWIDDASTSVYGPADGKKFGPADVGVIAEVGNQPVKILGTFKMGTGLAANGAMLVSRENYEKLTPGMPRGGVSMVLVRLHPSVDIQAGREAVIRRVRSLGGQAAHADVLTLDEVKQAERNRWYTETPIGMIFAMGVVLAVLVGGVISYMVLASDVLSHISEYATLKAMGYSNGYLIRTLLVQATLLAVMALPPSTLAAWGLYRITSNVAGIPINMTWIWISLVWTLSLVMCNAAGLFALRKLLGAQPADLF